MSDTKVLQHAGRCKPRRRVACCSGGWVALPLLQLFTITRLAALAGAWPYGLAMASNVDVMARRGEGPSFIGEPYFPSLALPPRLGGVARRRGAEQSGGGGVGNNDNPSLPPPPYAAPRRALPGRSLPL